MILLVSELPTGYCEAVWGAALDLQVPAKAAVDL